MMCPECKNKVYGNVCKNCGLVINEIELVNLPKRRKDDNNKLNPFSSEFTPDVRYMSKTKSSKKYFNKSKKHYLYVKAYVKINSLCTSLKLTKNVRNEALDIYRKMRKKNNSIFRKCGTIPSYLAFLKVAAEINCFPLFSHELQEYNEQPISNYNKALMITKKTLNIRFKRSHYAYFASYVCQKLNVIESVCKTIEIYNKLSKHFIGNQKTFIVAIVFLLHEKLFEKDFDFKKIFGTTKTTIKNKMLHIKRLIK